MPQKKWGTVCIAPCDNLASNAMGGFKEGSTAYRGCRHCQATPEEIRSVFKEASLVLRTCSDHSAKCDQLEAAETQRDRDKLSKEFGINHRSILDELKYFNVCSGGLVQDVMHDVLEGMYQVTVRIIGVLYLCMCTCLPYRLLGI